MLRFLIPVLVALAVQQPAPAQPPFLGHGPYGDKPGWHCYRGDTQEAKKLVHCDCKLHCDADGTPREGNDCQTYCATPSPCLCHSDELCDPPKGRR